MSKDDLQFTSAGGNYYDIARHNQARQDRGEWTAFDPGTKEKEAMLLVFPI